MIVSHETYLQGMLAMRRDATTVNHEDFVEGVAQERGTGLAAVEIGHERHGAAPRLAASVPLALRRA